MSNVITMSPAKKTLKERIKAKFAAILEEKEFNPEKLKIFVIENDGSIVEIKIQFSGSWYRPTDKFPAICQPGTILQMGVTLIDSAALSNGEIRLMVNQCDASEQDITRSVGQIMNLIEPYKFAGV